MSMVNVPAFEAPPSRPAFAGAIWSAMIAHLVAVEGVLERSSAWGGLRKGEEKGFGRNKVLLEHWGIARPEVEWRGLKNQLRLDAGHGWMGNKVDCE